MTTVCVHVCARFCVCARLHAHAQASRHSPSDGMICVSISFSGSWPWRFTEHVSHFTSLHSQSVHLASEQGVLLRVR